MKMDCSLLIALVKERRSLWDMDHDLYRSRHKARELWCEIGNIMGRPPATVKIKWQYLRDTYRREISKTDTDAWRTSKWRYFEAMNFLYDSYKPIPLSEMKSQSPHIDCNPVLEDSLQNSGSEYEGDMIDDKVNDHSLESEESFRKPEKLRLPRGMTSTASSKKISRVAYFKRIKEAAIDRNADYYFLMSLLPHLQAVPQHLKLETQIKMQQILLANQPTPSTAGNAESPKPSDEKGSDVYSATIEIKEEVFLSEEGE